MLGNNKEAISLQFEIRMMAHVHKNLSYQTFEVIETMWSQVERHVYNKG